MKKTPSSLKWLAEKRARIAGQLESQEQVLELIREDVAALEQALSKMGSMLVAAEARRANSPANSASAQSTARTTTPGLRPHRVPCADGPHETLSRTRKAVDKVQDKSANPRQA